ncbi:helix-turn-helix domain-containing protein [Clostridium sp.]|uniref:helix-turn-helix domain-containing protein n=1 Tax=Clostridium sp. TaxID=1506 RepID=UPI002915813A|nr:helix-turn-helix domain-containing protein [Clostridium sp.]MDU4847487.1 helix-turn-helix domain-containing protein [Clostridium sp.]
MGEENINKSEKEKIKIMRCRGDSYSKIAIALNISENTIKSFCRRNNLSGIKNNEAKEKKEIYTVCKQCGNPLIKTKQGQPKKFCCDKCRREWWKEHDFCIDKKAYYKLTCETCGKHFESYGNKNRKYCSHNCYINNRFGKGDRADERATV